MDVLEEADGRTRRRSRNREAVVLAALELIREHGRVPTMDEVADRSEVSARSVFRYFDDADDLVGAVIDQHRERLRPVWAQAEGLAQLPTLVERAAAFAEVRVTLLEAMGPVAWVARVRAADHPVIAAELSRVRAALRRQVAATFEAEFTGARGHGPALLAAADVLCSWEANDLHHHDHGLSRPDIVSGMAVALIRLLEPSRGCP